MTETALTVPEQTKLKQLEAVIESGLRTFIEVGNALLVIREKRLYREAHDSFENYCRLRWNMTRRRADQLVQSAEVISNLLPLREEYENHGSQFSNGSENSGADMPLPTSERQTRPLTELEPAEQRDAWTEAVATSRNGAPTSEEVAEVVDKRTGKKTPLDIIREWAASGLLGKRAASELESLGKSAHKRFVQLVTQGNTPADALKELSREPGDDRPPPPPPKPAKPRDELKDQVGNVLPDHLRDAFADPGLPTLIEELEQVEAMFRVEPWLDRAQKLTDHYGFILIEKFKEHAWEAQLKLQLALEALRAGVPHAVCPKCRGVDSQNNGKTCKGCRGYGHVPETRFKELST